MATVLYVLPFRAMRKSEFRYDLPPELIAQFPPAQRGASRMLELDGETGAIRDGQFSDLPSLLRAGDLLVMNDTRVIPARLFGKKETGGKVEILIERIVDDGHVLAQIRASKPPAPGMALEIGDGICFRVAGHRGDFYELTLPAGRPALDVLFDYGHVPLPPYIGRGDEPLDRERYQTVYARRHGAVAAPTAGLHFDEGMLQKLDDMGVKRTFITLHVGAGTFQPVREDDIQAHRMHAEYLEVSEVAAAQVNATRRKGGRVIAVGSTVVRALETAAGDGEVAPFREDTTIFIYPGYRFRAVDAMLTNFHLPESTLLMLVCAFAGRENVLNAYRHAVRERYRFYSYGDVMFVNKVV